MSETPPPSKDAANALVLAVVLPAAVTFYTDWLWFGETATRRYLQEGS